MSDEICKEHGVSVIEEPVGKGVKYNYYKLDQAGMPTRYSVAREAIDKAISESRTMREFEYHLNDMGYYTQFNPRRKYWTITPKESKPIRLYRLGPEYTNERIFERVQENALKLRTQSAGLVFYSEPTKKYKLPTRRDKIKKVGGLKGLYLKYCYELGYLPRYNQKPSRVHYLLRDDLLKCEMFSQQARLLGKYNISTVDELSKHLESVEMKISRLTAERTELRKEIRRVIPEAQQEIYRQEISMITAELKELRQEKKLCEDIKDRSEKVEEKLKRIDKEKEMEDITR